MMKIFICDHVLDNRPGHCGGTSFKICMDESGEAYVKCYANHITMLSDVIEHMLSGTAEHLRKE